MFFFFSKILLFIFSPLIWAFILLVWALLTKKPKRRRNLLLSSVLIIYLFSNSFLFDEAMRNWEMHPSYQNNNKVYDYAVVLGGVTSYHDKKNNQIGFYRSVDRLMQAIILYKKGIVKKIVFTGGDATILEDGNKEADIIAQYLKDIGLPAEDLIFENNSRNTHENAVYVHDLLKPSGNENILLITSAFHMRRALGCFKKEGMSPDYYVADRYSGKRKYVPDHLLIPNSETLDRWSMLFHEMSGYVIYKIMGYI